MRDKDLMIFFSILGTFFASQIRTHIAQIQTHVSISGEMNLSSCFNIICKLLIDCIGQYTINGCTVKVELCQNDYIFLPQRTL